jgi:hypothetical protein
MRSNTSSILEKGLPVEEGNQRCLAQVFTPRKMNIEANYPLLGTSDE